MAATTRSARAAGARTVARAPAPLLVVASAFSVQSGAAVAAGLFDRVGPLPVAWLRSLFAALVLLAIDPSIARRLRAGPLRWVLALGVTFAAMNSCVYEAIDHAPLGIVVTVEFLGPLALAVLGSRRPLDFLWIGLAAGGVALLGSPSANVSALGLVFSLLAAVCWATYILLAKRMVASWPFTTGLCLSLAVGGVVLAPVGAVKAGGELGAPGVLGVALAVALLSSVIPYVLELAALRRLRTSTFGIMMSLEPAVAALVGAVVLAQRPGLLGALAIVFVTVASIGANRERRDPLPPEA
jgi:inner membrane transporter RhtA